MNPSISHEQSQPEGHPEGHPEPSQQDISDVPQSRSEQDSAETHLESDNTHICDNSNDSSDNSNVQQTSPTTSGDNSDPDSNRGDNQLEPVISLHYSTEGTTSSTIRLGFARFENLEAGILQRSAENASLSPLVTEPVANQDQSDVLHDSISPEVSQLPVDMDSHGLNPIEGDEILNSDLVQEEIPQNSTSESEITRDCETTEEANSYLSTDISSQTVSMSDNTESQQCESSVATQESEPPSHSELTSANDVINNSYAEGQRSSESLETPPMSSPISHLHIKPGDDTNRGSSEGSGNSLQNSSCLICIVKPCSTQHEGKHYFILK